MAKIPYGQGVRKLSERVVQDGRTLVYTEEDADKLDFSEIPDGSLKVNKETGVISVKLAGQSDWVTANLQNDGTLNIAKDNLVNVETFTIVNTDCGNNEFQYKNSEGSVRRMPKTSTGGYVFELEKGSYQKVRSHLEVTIDDLLKRDAASGNLIEQTEKRFVLEEELQAGMKITARYARLVKIGNPYPRVFISSTKPEAAEAGDIWIDTSESTDNEKAMPDTEAESVISWDRVTGTPNDLRGYGITDKVSYEGHTHSYIDIVDFPQAMPANGGAADYATQSTEAAHAANSDNAKKADNATSANHADSATTAATASYASRAGSADSAKNADFAKRVDTANNANMAARAQTAAYADKAQRAEYVDSAAHATKADSATYANSAGSARIATQADKATQAINAQMATQATKASEATHAVKADNAKWANSAGSATNATKAASATYAANSGHADKADYAANADYSATCKNAQYASLAVKATNADNAAQATHAKNADRAMNADQAANATHADQASKADNASRAASAANADSATRFGGCTADFSTANNTDTWIPVFSNGKIQHTDRNQMTVGRAVNANNSDALGGRAPGLGGNQVPFLQGNGQIYPQNLCPHKHSSSDIIGGAQYGMIMMWYGDANYPPRGWRICNGQYGTPDLRDRFIVGAGASYGKGATGGLNTVKLTTKELPNTGDGLVGRWTSETGNETYINGDSGRYGATGYGFVTVTEIYNSNRRNGGGDHNVSDYEIDFRKWWGGQAHENRPPFYALYYIMYTG